MTSWAIAPESSPNTVTRVKCATSCRCNAASDSAAFWSVTSSEHPAELIRRSLPVMCTGTNPDPARLAIWAGQYECPLRRTSALRFPRSVSTAMWRSSGWTTARNVSSVTGRISRDAQYRPAVLGSPQFVGCPIKLPQSDTGGNGGKGHAVLALPRASSSAWWRRRR